MRQAVAGSISGSAWPAQARSRRCMQRWHEHRRGSLQCAFPTGVSYISSHQTQHFSYPTILTTIDERLFFILPMALGYCLENTFVTLPLISADALDDVWETQSCNCLSILSGMVLFAKYELRALQVLTIALSMAMSCPEQCLNCGRCLSLARRHRTSNG